MLHRLSPWLLIVALSAAPALAAPDCEDDFSECKDDCVVAFGGSVRLDMKKSFDKCMRKCTKKENTCTEHETETRTNQLEEGALDKSPGSDEVDSNNMPTRTTGGEPGRKKKKKVTAEPSSPDGDPDEAPAKPKEALGETEVPRSARTKFKSEEEKPAPKPPKEDKPKGGDREKVADEQPSRGDDERVVKVELKPKADEEDLRDDRPAKRERDNEGRAAEARSNPEPVAKKKVEDKPKEPPPKKRDDDDDLRNF